MHGPIDSRQLRAFSILAKTGSFTQTARELHLTQSAISHAIKALEEDIGCPLLHRMGKKVAPTEAGEQLLASAEKILAEMLLVREQLDQMTKWGRGRLRLGTIPTASQYVLPRVLREFKAEFPDCAIQIVPGNTAEVIEALRANRVDLALALEPKQIEQFVFHPLFTDELNFIVSPEHPWTRAGRVTRAEITRQSFILYSKSSYVFGQIRDYFLREKIVLPSTIELGNMETIKELVKLGVGVSIFPTWTVRKELEEKSLIMLPLGKRKLRRRWGILHWRARRLTAQEKAFMALCATLAEHLV
jgi:LysR family transcriptional regulator, low CO2-responsive transcriptional regulator